MPNTKTDSKGFSTENADTERDNGAKGGPAIGAGIPDDHHGISHPYDEDLQTQIAAKGKKHKAAGNGNNQTGDNQTKKD